MHVIGATAAKRVRTRLLTFLDSADPLLSRAALEWSLTPHTVDLTARGGLVLDYMYVITTALRWLGD